ncbi:MAG: peptide chain release factor N(5)-glutamine methyltransferase [Desulfurobacteriaceae bacterium]
MKWTVGTLLKRATEILKERGIKSARLDAELLLTFSLGFKDRVKLYTEFDRPLEESEVERYRQLLKRRAKGEPVAYIIGEKEFFGFKFNVKRGVLIPRPETEILVEAVFDAIKERDNLKIVDVGTGSGCIILSLCKLLKKENEYIGTDISSTAISVAKLNKEMLGCQCVKFIKTNLLDGIESPIDVIISNPPYVPFGDKRLERDVLKFEPAIALFGGKDGLQVIRRLIKEAEKKLTENGLIALEIGAGQHGEVEKLLEEEGFKDITFFKDLAGIERIVLARKE